MESEPQASTCPQCLKRRDLCVCSELKPVATQTHILILQHPQEPDKELGSARLAHLSLPNSTLKVGLSWPNLKAALGREVQPSRWAVLYLGSGIQGGSPSVSTDTAKKSRLQLVTKKGEALPEAENQKTLADLEGIVLLDGTWSQAKALWWRNAWLLKLRRAILVPGKPSLYKELRREPRRECLSTIETISESLSAMGEPDSVSESLTHLFDALLKKYRVWYAKNGKPRGAPGSGSKARPRGRNRFRRR